jgi:hypothetical protein
VEYVAVVLIAAFAAFVQASVGFGYALVFAPAAAFLIAPSEAIAVSIASSAAVNTLLYVEYRPRTNLRAVWPLVVASIVATPLGLRALIAADEELLRLLIATGVFLSAAVNLRHPSRHGPPREERLSLQLLVGGLGGAIRGAVSMGGPPVILYQHWIGGGAAAIRSKMFAFFFWGGFPAVALAIASGVLDSDSWPYVLAASVGLPAGIYVGRGLRPRISEVLFGRLSMALLGGTAGMAAIGASLAIAA